VAEAAKKKPEGGKPRKKANKEETAGIKRGGKKIKKARANKALTAIYEKIAQKDKEQDETIRKVVRGGKGGLFSFDCIKDDAPRAIGGKGGGATLFSTWGGESRSSRGNHRVALKRKFRKGENRFSDHHYRGGSLSSPATMGGRRTERGGEGIVSSLGKLSTPTREKSTTIFLQKPTKKEGIETEARKGIFLENGSVKKEESA